MEKWHIHEGFSVEMINADLICINYEPDNQHILIDVDFVPDLIEVLRQIEDNHGHKEQVEQDKEKLLQWRVSNGIPVKQY